MSHFQGEKYKLPLFSSTAEASTTIVQLTTTTQVPTTTEDVCLNVTCQNGGVCVREAGKAACRCDGNYTGDQCQYGMI